MKTSKELIERLQADEAFAKEVEAAVKAKIEAGAKDRFDAFVSAAADFGYEVPREELEAIAANSEQLSEEELGKLSGGTDVLYSFFYLIDNLFGDDEE